MYQECIKRIEKLLKYKNRIIIGIYGIPGAGKSTFALKLQNQLPGSVVAPMDGFHLYKSELAQLDDPEEAFRKRGAPFTFNALGFLQFVSQLYTENDIYAPSFDHTVGDPIPNDILIPGSCRVVLVEGLYLGLLELVWKDVEFDQLWMISIPIDIAMQRVVERHVQSGICKDKEQAMKRVALNDCKNAETILKNSKRPDFVIDYDTLIE